MQMYLKKFKYGLKSGIYLGLAILFVSMGWGCSSTHKTTKTETTVTYPNGAVANESGQSSGDQDRTVVVEKSETTTTTAETKTEHPGVISSTFHAIGYVISLPFIIIGGLFRTLFGG